MHLQAVKNKERAKRPRYKTYVLKGGRKWIDARGEVHAIEWPIPMRVQIA